MNIQEYLARDAIDRAIDRAVADEHSRIIAELTDAARADNCYCCSDHAVITLQQAIAIVRGERA